MSTRWELNAPHARARSSTHGAVRRLECAEEIALVARSRRDLLLRVHRHRLRWEDLEDCFGQATLELISCARDGTTFASRAHVANTLELRFLSRVRDRRRALSGRSQIVAAEHEAASLSHAGELGIDVADRSASVEARVLLRDEVREIRRAAEELSFDQRLVLSAQVAGVDCESFCRHWGWSREKYRKVAQRGRSRLRDLVSAQAAAVPHAACASDRITGRSYGNDHHRTPSTARPGPPAVGRTDDDTAMPVCARAAGGRGTPRSGSGRKRGDGHGSISS